jgi:hypothetical protein
VRLAFNLELITPRPERRTKEKEYYSLLVDRELKKFDRPSDSTGRLYAARAAVVNEIMAGPDDGRPFPERLRESLARHFGG